MLSQARVPPTVCWSTTSLIGYQVRTIGAYEAKTHLPRLLREVAASATFVITNHGIPVARLVPSGTERRPIAELMAEARKLRAAAKPLGELTIRDLIEEGRRF